MENSLLPPERSSPKIIFLLHGVVGEQLYVPLNIFADYLIAHGYDVLRCETRVANLDAFVAGGRKLIVIENWIHLPMETPSAMLRRMQTRQTLAFRKMSNPNTHLLWIDDDRRSSYSVADKNWLGKNGIWYIDVNALTDMNRAGQYLGLMKTRLDEFVAQPPAIIETVVQNQNQSSFVSGKTKGERPKYVIWVHDESTFEAGAAEGMSLIYEALRKNCDDQCKVYLVSEINENKIQAEERDMDLLNMNIREFHHFEHPPRARPLFIQHDMVGAALQKKCLSIYVNDWAKVGSEKELNRIVQEVMEYKEIFSRHRY